ncbi:MAG: type II secretion system major pseudopilin GspG [Planctomycetes bacterium]|nr:type II secretion system major pseudopilin GspG [Planctomycetota bacterium]
MRRNRTPQRLSRLRRGFTLVELIVVIAIIGVLATVVVVRFTGKTDQAKVATAKAHIAQLEGAVIEFQAHCGRLPESLDELVTRPSDCPNWQEGGYLKGKRPPKDPWGHEYKFGLENAEFVITCLGADGQEGGEGVARDLTNLNLDGAE